MRKNLFWITKILARFLNKLMNFLQQRCDILQGFILVENMCKQQQNIHLKKAFKIKQSKQKSQADYTNYSTECWLHILESAYIYCVYIVSLINSERNNNIHMLGWKFVPLFDNNKNALTKKTCANSFLALCVKTLPRENSPSRKCIYVWR